MTTAIPTIPIERFQLKCGATLLVSPRPGAPICAVQAHIRGGHSLDPLGKEGLSAFTGRLIDQGTERYDEEAFAAKLEIAGGSLSGSSTGVSGTIASGSWQTLLELFCEGLARPSYPNDEFKREQRRILDRLEVERDDPRAQGSQRFRKLVYGDHFLARPEYGTIASVQTLTRRDLIKHHKRNWCGARTLIAFCGDVEPAQVAKFLDRRLKGWPKGTDLAPASQEFPEHGQRLDAFFAQRQQVHLYFGHLGIRRTHEDYAPLVVMDHVLGTGPGFTNRIARILRDELGLAYTVHASIHSSAGVFPGMFSAYIGTSPEHVETALKGFVEQVERIRNEPVTVGELDLAKSYLTGSFALGFERASRRVGAMISSHRIGLGENYIEELLRGIEAVTIQDVQNAAAKHLVPEKACVVAAGPIRHKDLAAIVPVR